MYTPFVILQTNALLLVDLLGFAKLFFKTRFVTRACRCVKGRWIIHACKVRA